jgi:MPBQ/MSBQ methyltransferase
MMNDDSGGIETHYARAGLSDRILVALSDAGKDLDALTLDDLAPIDQFHTGGADATRTLARLVAIERESAVLDVGGGLGGPARFLARYLDCSVTVLDRTDEFCRAGEMLTARLGISDQVRFVHGDALDLPYAPGCFDAVWLQNVAMNIADAGALYRGIYRVLRPGGRLALQTILAGPIQPLHLPVAWARDTSMNFLRTPTEERRLLHAAGFEEQAWTEVPRQCNDETPQRQLTMADLPRLDFHLFLGEEYSTMVNNFVRNRRERRMTPIQGAFTRPG